MVFNLILLIFICIALLTIHIVSKQLYVSMETIRIEV